jgi:hypothetical protein
LPNGLNAGIIVAHAGIIEAELFFRSQLRKIGQHL